MERDLPNKEDGGLFNKLVCLSVALEIDFSPSTTLAVIIEGVGCSYLIASCKFFWPFKTFDQVGEVESEISLGLGPWEARPTLKVRHESLCSRVESVDDHLSIGRTGDLDSAILARGLALGSKSSPPILEPWGWRSA